MIVQFVTLKGNIDPGRFVTGVCVGIYGTQISDNQFEVEQVVLPSLPKYVERPLLKQDVYVYVFGNLVLIVFCRYVAFVSGLTLGDKCDSGIKELNSLSQIFVSISFFSFYKIFLLESEKIYGQDCSNGYCW